MRLDTLVHPWPWGPFICPYDSPVVRPETVKEESVYQEFYFIFMTGTHIWVLLCYLWESISLFKLTIICNMTSDILYFHHRPILGLYQLDNHDENKTLLFHFLQTSFLRTSYASGTHEWINNMNIWFKIQHHFWQKIKWNDKLMCTVINLSWITMQF